jgi:hypothetical protein
MGNARSLEKELMQRGAMLDLSEVPAAVSDGGQGMVFELNSMAYQRDLRAWSNYIPQRQPPR